MNYHSANPVWQEDKLNGVQSSVRKKTKFQSICQETGEEEVSCSWMAVVVVLIWIVFEGGNEVNRKDKNRINYVICTDSVSDQNRKSSVPAMTLTGKWSFQQVSLFCIKNRGNIFFKKLF